MARGNSTRRQFLRALSGTALTTGIAGCLDGSGDGDSTATGSATASETETTGEETNTSSETTTETSGPTDVTFQSTADTTVEGTLFAGGPCGIILVPQVNRDRKSWFPQARVLEAQGYTVLPIDEGEKPPAAVLGAMQFLREKHNVKRIVLVGASSGGEAVVRANARADADTVDGLITLSAAGGADRASELQGRTLFVVSKNDEQRFVKTTRTLHENAPKPKRLEVLSGDAHGQRIFESAQGDKLRSATLELLENACQEKTTKTETGTKNATGANETSSTNGTESTGN